jgi:hypothetical protein
MSGRFWISGVQLGMLMTTSIKLKKKMEITKQIMETQFIGDFSDDADKQKFLKKIKEAFP